MRGDPHVRFGGRAGETDRRRRRRRAPRPTLPIGQQRFPFPKTWPAWCPGAASPGGRLGPESVDDLDRNQWTGSTGMGGRFHPEWSMADEAAATGDERAPAAHFRGNTHWLGERPAEPDRSPGGVGASRTTRAAPLQLGLARPSPPPV